VEETAQTLASYSPLGRRYWRARVLWGASSLAVASIVLLILLSQEYLAFVQDASRPRWQAFPLWW